VSANEQQTRVPRGTRGTGPPPNREKTATKEGRELLGNRERESKTKREEGERSPQGAEGKERGAPEKLATLSVT
jgi:hypothetical protein